MTTEHDVGPAFRPTPPPARLALSRRILLLPLTRLVVAAVLYLLLTTVLGVLLPRNWILGRIPFSQVVEFVSALLTLLTLAWWVERRPLAHLGLRCAGALPEFGLGAVLGALLITAVIGIMALAGWYRATGVEFGSKMGMGLLRLLVLIGLSAAAEEFIFRAAVFRIAEEGLGSWLALGFSGAWFAWMHLHNPHTTFLSTAGVALAGVFFGLAFMLTRNLWLATGIHFAWNFFEGPVYGAPISGYKLDCVIHAAISGPPFATGGAFGPEAGVIAFLVNLAFTAALLVLVIRRRQFFAPRWMRRVLGVPWPAAGHAAPAPYPWACANTEAPAPTEVNARLDPSDL